MLDAGRVNSSAQSPSGTFRRVSGVGAAIPLVEPHGEDSGAREGHARDKL